MTPSLDSLDATVTRVVCAFVRDDGPGAAVLIVADGRILHQRGYGLADLEARTPVTPWTAFDLASVSKQFTAMGVMILARRGMLSFTDDLRFHLPEWPCHDEERPIRLLDLLHHTSGVPNYSDVWTGPGEDAHLSNADYLEQLAQHPLDFPTGTRAEYSNSNYILLAEVLERVSGKSFRAFMQEEVFGPLEMKNSWIHDDHALEICNRARGYKAVETGGFEKSDFPIVLVGHSHLFTTLEDMTRWVQALHGHRLVAAEDLARAYATGALDKGERHIYGFGWYEELREDKPVRVHSGSWYGFQNYACQFVEEKLAVVVLSNNESLDGEGLVNRLIEAYRASSR